MKLSLNWLSEFVPFRQAPALVAERLTLGGFEVESIEHWGQGLEKVVVGQIKTIIDHAEADRLSVCKVDIGKKQLLNIVCGARNIKPWQKVPVALVGAKLPNGLVIERRKIRGVESMGMICAADELGMGTDHSGIMVLDPDLKLGQPLGKALGIDDTVLDVSVGPHRPDALSVVGLAREFSALAQEQMQEPTVRVTESKKHSAKQSVKVHVQDGDLCPKYTARVIRNVRVKPSPAWLQSRLRVCGLNPVNNVVDATNFVMLELGQPLHAFDLSRLAGHTINVRKASLAEARRAGKAGVFTTLDGVERKLTPEMLVISDAKQPIAIAGVMGGNNSEITKQTKDIVLESAIFKPISIRHTRQKLGLATDASVRFEKGIWWSLPELALDRAAQLIADIAKGDVAKGIISVSSGQVKSRTIKLPIASVNNVIGRIFSIAEVKKNLEKLSFGVRANGASLTVTVPEWRQDVRLPVDLIEEAGRIVGWNTLKRQPVYGSLRPVKQEPLAQWQERAKDALASTGMVEVLSYSFYGADLMAAFDLHAADHYAVSNPLNPGQAFLRTTLVPQLYQLVMKNYQSRDAIKCFEIGRVFKKIGGACPEELTLVSGIIYQKAGTSIDALKQTLGALFHSFGIDRSDVHFSQRNDDQRVDITIGKETVGQYSVLAVSSEKLRQAPAWFECDLLALSRYASNQQRYQPLPQYPSIWRDLTLKAGGEADYRAIVQAIRECNPLVAEVRGIDLYREQDGTGSITIRVTYRSAERTLQSDEVDAVEEKIIKTITGMFPVTIKR